MVSDCHSADSSSADASADASNGEAASTSRHQCNSTYLLQLQFVRSVLSVNPCVVSFATSNSQCSEVEEYTEIEFIQ